MHRYFSKAHLDMNDFDSNDTQGNYFATINSKMNFSKLYFTKLNDPQNNYKKLIRY